MNFVILLLIYMFYLFYILYSPYIQYFLAKIKEFIGSSKPTIITITNK